MKYGFCSFWSHYSWTRSNMPGDEAELTRDFAVGCHSVICLRSDSMSSFVHSKSRRSPSSWSNEFQQVSGLWRGIPKHTMVYGAKVSPIGAIGQGYIPG
jgi:hypothetical protein